MPVSWLYTYPVLSPWYNCSTPSLSKPEEKPVAWIPLVSDHSNPLGVRVPITPLETAELWDTLV